MINFKKHLHKNALKVIIAGGRDFKDYTRLFERVSFYLYEKTFEDKPIVIVSGGAKGADSLGEKYAIEKNYKIVQFLPDWENNGKSAGHIRNREMGDFADYLIAFWDGKSLGTKGMIDYANYIGIPVRVVKY